VNKVVCKYVKESSRRLLTIQRNWTQHLGLGHTYGLIVFPFPCKIRHCGVLNWYWI